MHALIVVANPKSDSLSHSIAAHVAEGVSLSSQGNTFEIADLHAEGFDPRYTTADLALHSKLSPPPADVAKEQARIDQADDLVLIFPIYWWSMPAMLKGWVDRVFANGWAFDYPAANGGLEKRLSKLRMHLIGIGGADARAYEKHGYGDAMKKLIDQGIFDYCGAQVITSKLLLESEVRDPTPHLNYAHDLGQNLFDKSPQFAELTEA